MSKMLKIEVGGKEYILGFPTRRSGKIAEDYGLDLMSGNGKLITLNDKLFYTGLLAEQPNLSEREAEKIFEKYREEGGDTDEVIVFLTGQYMDFIKSPEGEKKKKAQIVEV